MRGRLTIALATLAMAAAPAAAQRDPVDVRGQEKETAWREMNGFHSLMHVSYHPMKKSGDLAPARRNAALMADAADVWAKSTAPAECKAPANIGETLATLAAESRAYAKLVEANGSDEEVKTALINLHERFEGAHQACMAKGKAHIKEHTPPAGR